MLHVLAFFAACALASFDKEHITSNPFVLEDWKQDDETIEPFFSAHGVLGSERSPSRINFSGSEDDHRPEKKNKWAARRSEGNTKIKTNYPEAVSYHRDGRVTSKPTGAQARGYKGDSELPNWAIKQQKNNWSDQPQGHTFTKLDRFPNTKSPPEGQRGRIRGVSASSNSQHRPGPHVDERNQWASREALRNNEGIMRSTYPGWAARGVHVGNTDVNQSARARWETAGIFQNGQEGYQQLPRWAVGVDEGTLGSVERNAKRRARRKKFPAGMAYGTPTKVTDSQTG